MSGSPIAAAKPISPLRRCWPISKQRGMLEDTLVVWGGEFGRTSMRENRDGQVMKFVGRDHNPGAFTIWMAGGGVKPGISSRRRPTTWAMRS